MTGEESTYGGIGMIHIGNANNLIGKIFNNYDFIGDKKKTIIGAKKTGLHRSPRILSPTSPAVKKMTP